MSKKNKLFDNMGSMANLNRKVLGKDAVIQEIELNRIKPNPYQPRKDFDEELLLDLGNNIKDTGLENPIVVIQKDSNYILVSGERRVRSSKLVGLSMIKAIVRETKDDEMQKKALWENILRENLTPIEQYEALISIKKNDNITNDQELAKHVYMPYSTLRRLLSLEKLSKELFEFIKVQEKKPALGVLERLSTVEQGKAYILAKYIVQNNLSRTEAIIYINSNERVKKETSIKKPLNNTWGIYKETKKKFEIKIDRSKIDAEQNQKIEKLLKDINNILNAPVATL